MSKESIEENVITKEVTSFFDDIKSTLLQRFSAPIYVSIGCVFFIDYWDKILCLIFGTGSIQDRTSAFKHSLHNLHQPVLWAILIALLMPFVSRFFELVHLLSDWIQCYISTKRDHMKLKSIDDTHKKQNKYRIDQENREKEKDNNSKECDELIIKLEDLKNKHSLIVKNSASILECLVEVELIVNKTALYVSNSTNYTENDKEKFNDVRGRLRDLIKEVQNENPDWNDFFSK